MDKYTRISWTNVLKRSQFKFRNLYTIDFFLLHFLFEQTADMFLRLVVRHFFFMREINQVNIECPWGIIAVLLSFTLLSQISSISFRIHPLVGGECGTFWSDGKWNIHKYSWRYRECLISGFGTRCWFIVSDLRYQSHISSNSRIWFSLRTMIFLIYPALMIMISGFVTTSKSFIV